MRKVVYVFGFTWNNSFGSLALCGVVPILLPAIHGLYRFRFLFRYVHFVAWRYIDKIQRRTIWKTTVFSFRALTSLPPVWTYELSPKVSTTQRPQYHTRPEPPRIVLRVLLHLEPIFYRLVILQCLSCFSAASSLKVPFVPNATIRYLYVRGNTIASINFNLFATIQQFIFRRFASVKFRRISLVLLLLLSNCRWNLLNTVFLPLYKPLYIFWLFINKKSSYS